LYEFFVVTLGQWFATADDENKTSKESAIYYSHRRIKFVANAITLVSATFFMLVPVTLLFILKITNWTKLGIVIVFGLLFPGVIAACTKIEPQQVFMMTAA
jgi:hypothetical protein